VFDPDSRYARLPTVVATTATGRNVVLVSRRLLPPLPSEPMATITSEAGDRLDLVATRVFGDPLLWWQVADANGVLDPSELETEPGRPIDIAPPRL
jgi:hypothetical protein